MKKFLFLCLTFFVCAGMSHLPSRADFFQLEKQVKPKIEKRFTDRNLQLGDPVYVRIFKQESILEIWVKDGPHYRFYKAWPICKYSGRLGPKLREGDKQAPEGFYNVTLDDLNPDSQFHLSFNLGFPNAYDAYLDRTGSFLMVHGGCRSTGCYAMTDKGIEEIYTIVEQALLNGQSQVPVHIFPFQMNATNMAFHATKPWINFWRNLQEGYELFNQSLMPPSVFAQNGRYVFGPSSGINYGHLNPD